MPTADALAGADQAQPHGTQHGSRYANRPLRTPAFESIDPWASATRAVLVDSFEAAHTARVDNVLLGGFHHLAVDRRFAGRLATEVPGIGSMVWHNRMFQRRVVEYLLAIGIRQFIDLGCGIPTLGAVHEIARDAAVAVKVAYVDNEPVTVELGRILLADDARALIIRGDLRNPYHILGHPQINDLLDLGQPVAVLALAALHHLSDEDAPAAITTAFRDWTVSGSYLALSHYCHEGQLSTMTALAQATQKAGGATTPRSRAQIRELFRGWRLLPPGLTWTAAWRPEPHTYPDLRTQPQHAGMLAGLAYQEHKSGPRPKPPAAPLPSRSGDTGI